MVVNTSIAGRTPEWHRGWKSRVPPKWCEVTIRRGGKWHRADIQRNDGLVVELQHSPISPREIREREEFYGNMVWLFDGQPRDWSDFARQHCRRRAFLDLGGRVVELWTRTGAVGGLRDCSTERWVGRWLSEVAAHSFAGGGNIGGLSSDYARAWYAWGSPRDWSLMQLGLASRP